ncbi:MAG: hypothetical protein E3K37_04950 [Candidatus Kuenenia sp.]|nr:hypothetical protein [Candidatus Kuenenia hertensis]
MVFSTTQIFHTSRHAIPSSETDQKILAWLKHGSKSHYEPPVHMKQISGQHNDVKELGKFFDAPFSGTKKMRPVSVINK